MNGLLDISPILASILTVLFPLLAFGYQAIVGKKDSSGLIGLVAIILSTVCSGVFVFAAVWQQAPTHATYEWFTVGNKTFTLGVLLNNLTVLMQFLVCVIALPVHIYSRAYMKGDTGLHRYWMYLSLFCFAMLGLTVSKNLLMMYIFWELVGFASYLLIGFWFTRERAVQANKKAFIINRVGDVGFLIGIGLVFSHFGTLDLVELFGTYSPILASLGTEEHSRWLTGAGIAFFVGAMAKSAQFPLHVWLPDAMEGPTSVSSLIHAATMVAAGVFLLATLFPLFNETVLLLMTIVGTLTAASGAYFALTQYDIKRVLAFSTISQLGFMVVGIGIGAWNAAIFHLVTHAFFKCLLFLCAGAVIHGMSHVSMPNDGDFDPQDMRNMGSLRRYMPRTFILMVIASLALAGFPLTSGFLSKDAIVITAFEWALAGHTGYLAVPIILVLVSLFTAFYIGRLIFKTFFGEARWAFPQDQTATALEAPKTMFYPMLFLWVGSFFLFFSLDPLSYDRAGLMQGLVALSPYEPVQMLHLLIPTILTIGSVLCWMVGWRWYVRGSYPLQTDTLWMRLSLNQGYLDRIYTAIFVNATLRLSQGLYWFDRRIVDGIVDGAAVVIRYTSQAVSWIDRYIVDGIVVHVVGQGTYYLGHLLRWVQNGRLQGYIGFAFTMVLLGILYLILS